MLFLLIILSARRARPDPEPPKIDLRPRPNTGAMIPKP